MAWIIGFDTSCYTTSVAVVTEYGQAVASQRRLLQVPAGSRGLRQSEMVFQHNAALPQLLTLALEEARMGSDDDIPIAALCASARPRDVESSYMPAFTVGEGYARALSVAMKVPLFLTTHQQGHIAAARVGTNLDACVGQATEHLALHLSGGTTELLLCSDHPPKAQLLGGTLDIALGQLVDRVGVKLGLPFPAGPHLEALAEAGVANVPTVSLKELNVNLSGAEAAFMRRIEAGEAPRDVAASVFAYAANVIAMLLEAGMQQTGVQTALLMGGVASSHRLRDLLAHKPIPAPEWASPPLSGDNAVGVAIIGAAMFTKQTITNK